MNSNYSIWHPLTQHKTAKTPIEIIKAKGVYLYDKKGNKYIDGICSWYTSVYGHCNNFIIKKATKQLKSLDQIVFSGLTHPPAIELSNKLLHILPSNQSKIFFSDNGSTSVEVALKMALQYFDNLGVKKSAFIAFENAFHGDTFGAMSASGLSIYNGVFKNFFITVKKIPLPNSSNYKYVETLLKQLISEYNVAGFIFEPLIQGASGMKMYDHQLLDKLIKICKALKILTIADEVMTGFGKTGRHFASDFLINKPDIICLSKALTAGVLPMAITSCSKQIYNAFYNDSITKGFFHGHTYTANPLACKIASTGIELLTSAKIQKNIEKINALHRVFYKHLMSYENVKNLRLQGVILAFEIDSKIERYGSEQDSFYDFFIKNGIFLRPLGNTIYIHPPYIISRKQLEEIYKTILVLLNKIKDDLR